jgi:hypothetical protein
MAELGSALDLADNRIICGLLLTKLFNVKPLSFTGRRSTPF